MLSLNCFQQVGLNGSRFFQKPRVSPGKARRRPPARSRPIAQVQSLEDRLCLSASPSTALIAAASSPPTVSVPASETVTKNTAFTFSSANGDPITFTDPSLAAGGFDTVALTVTHGTLLLGSPGSIAMLAGANSSASMTIKGTLPNLITALNGLSYTPNSNYLGSDLLTVQITNTGDGLSASASSALTVAIGSPPTVSAPASETVIENTAFTFSSANSDPITFTDTALPAGGFDTVALTVSHGTLLLGSPGSIAMVAGANNSDSMTIKGTLPNLIKALNGLSYTPSSNLVSSDSLTVKITNPGNGLSASASTTLTVSTAASTPPTVSAPASESVSENTAFIFSSANGDAITFTDPTFAAGGFDTVALTVSHGVLLLGSPGSIAVLSGANDSASMTIKGTLPNLTKALNGLSYTPNSNFVGPDSLTVKITNTGNGLSASATTALTVATTSPPSVSAPASETVIENIAFTFSSANSDAITFTDAALPAGSFDTVALTVSHGVLLLGSPGSIAMVAGANNSASMTIQGTLPNLIKALNGLTYTPSSNFVGSDSLTVKITNTGNGLSGSSSTALTVSSTASNPPTVPAPASETVIENTTFTFSSANGDAITLTDPTLAAGGFDTVALTVSHGTLLLGSPGSIAVLSGANNSASMTIKGTLPNLIKALNGLIYTPSSNFLGSDSLAVKITNTGNGLSGSASTALTVATTPPPTVSAPASETVTKNTAFNFSSAGSDPITFTDPALPAGGFDTVALTVSHGTLLLGSPGSIAMLSGANGSASMTIEGTLPNLIRALNGLTYTPSSNFLGSDSLTVKITNTSDGLSASSSTALTVQATPAASPALTTSTNTPDTTQTDQSNNWMGVAPAVEALNS
jgi:large repetitive protein